MDELREILRHDRVELLREFKEASLVGQGTPEKVATERERAHHAVVLDDFPVLGRPPKKRTMYVVISLDDSLSGRIAEHLATFHLLQPVPFSPVATRPVLGEYPLGNASEDRHGRTRDYGDSPVHPSPASR